MKQCKICDKEKRNEEMHDNVCCKECWNEINTPLTCHKCGTDSCDCHLDRRL